MTTKMRLSLLAPLAAALCAVALSVPVGAAQPAGHDHAADAPHKLSLDKGRKWGTDQPLREGMGQIRELAAAQLERVHAGKMDPDQYRELSTRIEQQVGGIVANCKLDPKADAMLHLVIADIGAGTEAMAGKTDKVSAEKGYVKVVQAVNAYGRHFNHPGFKPVRTGH